MKKAFTILIVMCILFSTVACGTLHKQNNNDISFYYCKRSLSYNEADDVIGVENRSPDDIGNDLQSMITAYLSGPRSAALTALFPLNTTVKSISQSEIEVAITLSSACADMKELDFMLACACLAKTVLSYSSVENVQICSEKGYTDPIFFSADSFLTDADLQKVD